MQARRAQDQGQWQVAADAYEAAYVLTRDPERLCDLAVVHLRIYDQTGEPLYLRKSAVVLRNYLAELERIPYRGARPDTSQIVSEVERKLAGLDKSRSPSESTPSNHRERVQADVHRPSVEAPPSDRRQTRHPAARSRRNGLITLGAGSAVLVAGIVSAGVLFHRRTTFTRELDHAGHEWNARHCDGRPHETDCSTLASNMSALQSNRQLAQGLAYGVGVPALTIGAAATVVGALLLVWARKSPRSGTAMDVRVHPTVGGAMFVAHF